ncbi:hypothetical protein NC651_002409 [Populus alba x Populus x berolinensis]|nr:hypothetical protein NC651_002409 [Populus alba x Populus x berolinensis]
MAPSISARSIIIHFSLTKENEEQLASTPKHVYRSSVIQAPELKFSKGEFTEKEDDEQPVFLQATTPPWISTSCFIQTPQLQFPTGTVSLVPLAILILFLFIAMKLTCLCPF